MPKQVVKILRDGRIALPRNIRDQLNLRDGDLVTISINTDQVEITPVKVVPRQ